MHRNLHLSYQDPCQRLFNAIGMESYIRPHRHALVPRTETLMAVRGSFALVTFDDAGGIVQVLRMCSESFDERGSHAAGCEVPARCWHTVIAETPGAVLLELKDGPFDPGSPKELAPWAPEEGSAAARQYVLDLRREVVRRIESPAPR
jgi:cupin fold WbuC family metalloprotein